MPKYGRDLGVDLYELWLAGDKLLPAVADQFAEARRHFSDTEPDDRCFWRPPELGGGGLGPAQAAFAELRQTLCAVFRDSQDNLDLAAKGLKIAADGYARADGAARAEFLSMREDLGRRRY